MRYTELLRIGALLCGASGTTVAAATVAFGYDDRTQNIVLLSTIWWLICGTGALFLISRRGGKPSEAVERLLVDAPTQKMPEEPRVGRTLLSRLWPLALATLLAVIGGAVFGAQVSGITAGLPLAWAISWRAQEFAVKAVEERDGVAFVVIPTGPFTPIKLVRGPGLRRDRPVDLSIDPPRPR
ncbi:MAG: hypothetical protein PGN13_02380 [Patulibacter minatonensis]